MKKLLCRAVSRRSVAATRALICLCLIATTSSTVTAEDFFTQLAAGWRDTPGVVIGCALGSLAPGGQCLW